jgi:hypothetical protein
MCYYLILEGHSRCSSGTKGYSGVPSASESESESDISESGRSDEEADPYPYPLPFQCPQYCWVLPLVPPDPKHKSRQPRNSLSTPEPHGRAVASFGCFVFRRRRAAMRSRS